MTKGYINYNFNNLSCLDSFVLQVVCKRAASLLAFSDEELQKVRLELDNMRAERDRLQEILKMAGREKKMGKKQHAIGKKNENIYKH